MDITTGRTPVPAVYDPRYDPLVARHPGHGVDYAPTYWVATAGAPPADDGPIDGDVDVDVAIVGSGFTGLAAALFLAREHGIRATVLEANRTVWGCTSRNGGQGQNASGRLYRSQWIGRWGKETALRLDAEIREGFETFRSLVAEIGCDPQPGGHLYIAHRDKKMEFLRNEAKVMREVFGYDARILGRDEVHRTFVKDAETFGALHEPDGIGVHPLKLAWGYLRKARELGVKVHPASPVTGFETRNGVHLLRSPGGAVRARAVGFATGGYTSNGMHRSLDAKIMPILSNSLVTRPLTDAELESTNFVTTEVITDTRTLRFYYRKLPDNRVQIGSRSSITGADAPNPRHMAVLVDGLHRKFPMLKGIRIDYSWWGWVDVSHDMMPRVVQPDPREAVFYALGYGGNGVSFSAHAGRRMAERIAGRHSRAFDLPIYDSPLRYPMAFGALESRAFAPFRRLGQRALYRWYWLRDEFL
ncbi:MAG: FAD-binding oxidoreductase [Lautropia sp.]|nr:MAG: FAD-binding oxidoreductase [Pseudomonadota bacterium]MBC6959335.1 FAD-binding oxidoreductase [Lautropia sp.]MCL4701257.1 FAD-binding oxidoreductase [Burkholderiaceae bacterium]MDL1907399.1 FAD-binding oxidoreductase [Betaproteobacteria bacterium PRO1]RIK90001.1 MAG: FAD-dependent oxidoreductase [Burkholderiales bacterium]